MSDGANFSQQQEANQELNQELNQEFEYCLDDILASANFEPDPCAANASARFRFGRRLRCLRASRRSARGMQTVHPGSC